MDLCAFRTVAVRAAAARTVTADGLLIRQQRLLRRTNRSTITASTQPLTTCNYLLIRHRPALQQKPTLANVLHKRQCAPR